MTDQFVTDADVIAIAPPADVINALPPAAPTATISSPTGINQEVVFHTTLGDIVIELFADTPITTANFLNYVTHDKYDGTFFHRSVNNFVIQGGGYYYDGTQTTTVGTYAPITNEYSATHPNAPGTISMARTSDLNSATSQFFINTVDNSSPLVNYAVFGQIIQGFTTGGNTTGVVNRIAALPIYNAGGAFAELPLQNYPGTGGITTANIIYVISADVLAIAIDDNYTTGEASTVGGTLTSNDQDLDTATFSIAKVNGLAASVGQQITLASGAKVTVNANGTFSYDPNHAFDSLNTGQTGTDSFTYTLTNGSLVYGTAVAHISITGASSGTIFGQPNVNDNLTGTAGDDVIDGLSGADSMHGLGGNDTYYVDQQGDLVYEFPNDGNDTVIASSNYYLYPYVETLTLAAGAGNIFGVGNAQNNTINGNSGDNTLLGGAGHDIVNGGAGADIIYGEDGNDTLNGGNDNDFLAGGIGDDTIDGGNGGDSIYGEAGNDTLYGGTDFVFDILVGGDGSDMLHGDSGLGDYDYLYGNAGDDFIYVDTPNDLVFEQPGEGTDTVIANINGAGFYLYDNIENLTLVGTTPFGVGNALDNYLRGSDSNNYLLGGAGNDVLDGGGGDDVLFGEAGADFFRFTGVSGHDVVGDFQVGIDKIDLQFAGFSTYAQIQANMTENNGSTAIDLGRGNFLVINGVTRAQLHASDFVVAGGGLAGDVDVSPVAFATVTIAPIEQTAIASLGHDHGLIRDFVAPQHGYDYY